jgi:hypothetical protein
MDYVGIKTLKQAYAQQKIDDGDYARGLEIYGKDEITPIYEGLAVHPEVEPLVDNINKAFHDISIDVTALEGELTQAASDYMALMSSTITRLESVEQRIQTETDRLRDINAICGNYDDFGSVKNLDGTNVNGKFGWANNAFTGVIAGGSSGVVLTVNDVVGNGYEGNIYVEDSVGVQRENMVDGNELTRWEYSRYNSPEPPPTAPMTINADTEEARATVFLEGDQAFNTLYLRSDMDIVIDDILTSDNNIDWKSNLAQAIHINDSNAKYNDPEYIYDTGLIAFPRTNYVKLTLHSVGAITDENIVDTDGNILDGVVRHAIAINDIEAQSLVYSQGVISTGQLVARPIDCIAIFANEYIPPHYADAEYIEYYLTVNEKEYKVVPINSQKNGIKVIRFTSYTTGNTYVQHISETIKSAFLRVVIKTTADGSTPFLSNLKVCFGKVV